MFVGIAIQTRATPSLPWNQCMLLMKGNPILRFKGFQAVHYGFNHQTTSRGHCAMLYFQKSNPCEKIFASHAPHGVPWKSGFSPPCPKSSSLLSLFPRPSPSLPSSAFTLIHGHGRTTKRPERERGRAELGNAIHNPSLMPTTITSDARPAGSSGPTLLATAGCLQV